MARSLLVGVLEAVLFWVLNLAVMMRLMPCFAYWLWGWMCSAFRYQVRAWADVGEWLS